MRHSARAHPTAYLHNHAHSGVLIPPLRMRIVCFPPLTARGRRPPPRGVLTSFIGDGPLEHRGDGG